MEQSGTPKTENRIQAILTLDMDNIPSNFQETTLPLYKLKKNIEYYSLLKQF
jgi:hypothetical protein